MDWNSNLYDQKHSFVSKYGQNLLSYLQPKAGEKILDVGCGTGDLANLISEAGSSVTGIDSAAEMITTAQMKYPHLQFYKMDVKNIELREQFDAVFSNAVLHWVPEKEVAIKQFYNRLKPGGRFVAEFGGKGNNQTMLASMRKILREKGYHKNSEINFWYYPSIAEYATELEKQSFRVTHAEHFDRFTELVGEDGIKDWFKMFGNRFFKDISEKDKVEILEAIQSDLRSTHYVSGKWYADYKRIRVVAIKE